MLDGVESVARVQFDFRFVEKIRGECRERFELAGILTDVLYLSLARSLVEVIRVFRILLLCDRNICWVCLRCNICFQVLALQQHEHALICLILLLLNDSLQLLSSSSLHFEVFDQSALSRNQVSKVLLVVKVFYDNSATSRSHKLFGQLLHFLLQVRNICFELGVLNLQVSNLLLKLVVAERSDRLLGHELLAFLFSQSVPLRILFYRLVHGLLFSHSPLQSLFKFSLNSI